MKPRNLPEYLAHWVQIQPDKPFASFLDVRGEVKASHTYASFDRLSRALAAELIDVAGLSHGDRAVLAYAPGLDLIAAFAACARIGVIPAVAAPPRNRETRIRLAGIIRDCGPSAVLTDGKSRRLFETSADTSSGKPLLPSDCRLIETDNLPDSDAEAVSDTPHEILFLQYTSGSTGDPKGVVVSHDNVVNNCRAIVHDDAVGVSWLPQFHDMGLIGYYLFLIVTGGTTYGFAPTDFLRRPVLWLETLSRYSGTITSAPNFGFAYCLAEDRISESDLEGLDLSALRLIMNGSEPADPATCRRFQTRFARCGLRPEAFAVAYGLAENTLAVSLATGGRSLTVDKRALQEGKAVLAGDEPGKRTTELMSCGRALPGVRTRLVDEKTMTRLPDGRVGEIWVSGTSKCLGYWGQPELSRRIFECRLADEQDGGEAWLRTGDLGFVHDEELFVCGRSKDVVILRGRNFHANDLEFAIEEACEAIRPGHVVAFQETDGGGALVILIGVAGPDGLPDLAMILPAIRRSGYDGPVLAAAVPRDEIVRTSSGKLARNRLREAWNAGCVPVLEQFFDPGLGGHSAAMTLEERYDRLLSAFSLTGEEPSTLGELGLDSLAIVEFAIALESAVEGAAARADLRAILGGPLLQELRIADLTGIVRQLGRSDGSGLAKLEQKLADLDRARVSRDEMAMRRDARIELTVPAAAEAARGVDTILMTGATGFLGPFLLAELLSNSDARLRVLVRAADEAAGRARLRHGLHGARLLEPRIAGWLETRVDILCGDLASPALGLPAETWASLAREVDSIVHNGARLDYVLNYSDLKPPNVDGTRELLRLACTTHPKRFHHVSSTIIFGWAARERLLEEHCNAEMTGLDFGYAQSKWVAEQQVLAARAQGLYTRIYRPSFVTASLHGVGNRGDIVIRILAFMINHRLAPTAENQMSLLPVDIAARNMARLMISPDLDGGTFHVTVSDYYSLVDVTRIIATDYGIRFRYLDLEEFVQEMRRLCTEEDLVFPLLDFITRSRRPFAAMRHSRYCNDRYRAGLASAGLARPDPSLREIVAGLMKYMLSEGLISAEPRGVERPRSEAVS